MKALGVVVSSEAGSSSMEALGVVVSLEGE